MRQAVRGVMLPRVHRVRKGGKVYRWHRPTRTKLPDDIPETHPDFTAAWAAAEASAPRPVETAPAGTIAATVAAMLGSRKVKGYSAVYRHVVRREADEIRTEYGTGPMTGLRENHIRADLDKFAASKANARLKVWRLICGHAKTARTITSNPCAGLQKIPVQTDGFAPWSADDIAKFRTHWPIGSTQRACMELVFWTAARTVDAVAIGLQHIGSDGVLVFRQSKTGGRAYVPWSAPLPLWAQSWTAERDQMLQAIACLSGGLTFLQTAQGRPRSIKGLGNVVSTAARAAGLVDRSAHGLRKSRLTMIAEAGGSAHAIMAWGGHKTLAEAQRYTEAAEMRRLVTATGQGAEQERNVVNRPAVAVNLPK